jgi:hypothetical protein
VFIHLAKNEARKGDVEAGMVRSPTQQECLICTYLVMYSVYYSAEDRRGGSQLQSPTRYSGLTSQTHPHHHSIHVRPPPPTLLRQICQSTRLTNLH